MDKVRVPHEWSVNIEARSTVKGSRNWSGITTAHDIEDALDEVPKDALMIEDGEEQGPEGHVVYMKIEVRRV